jgi:hypothetical protein
MAQADQYDCASFGSQQSAQAEPDRDPSDPNYLDPDTDGTACEDYDYGSGGGSATTFTTGSAAQDRYANNAATDQYQQGTPSTATFNAGGPANGPVTRAEGYATRSARTIRRLLKTGIGVHVCSVTMSLPATWPITQTSSGFTFSTSLTRYL